MYPEAIVRPLPKPSELIDKTQPKQSTKLDPIVEFEENSPHQEGIILETYINLDQTYFERPQELTDLVNTTKLVQKYLPRQAVPLTIIEIQAGLFDQSSFQGYIQIFGSKHLTKKKACKAKGRKQIR